jgi:hypothetical protein
MQQNNNKTSNDVLTVEVMRLAQRSRLLASAHCCLLTSNKNLGDSPFVLSVSRSRYTEIGSYTVINES